MVEDFLTFVQTDGRTDGRTGRNLNTRKIVWRLNVTFYAATYHIIKKLGNLLTKYVCVFSIIFSLYVNKQWVFSVVSCAVRTESVYRMYSLRAGRSVDRISVGTRFFHNRPDRPWGPPRHLCYGYQVFPGGKAAGSWRWAPNPIKRRG